MYSKKIWLDKETSPSTCSMAAYHGPIHYEVGKSEITAFLKISTCHNQVHIHHTYDEQMVDYVKKLELLRDNIDNFIKYLNGEEA